MITSEDGSFIAKIVGDAHEARGDLKNQEVGDREMDLSNNACGREFGKKAKTTGDCQNMCMNAATSGKLTTYTPGTTPKYITGD